MGHRDRLQQLSPDSGGFVTKTKFRAPGQGSLSALIITVIFFYLHSGFMHASACLSNFFDLFLGFLFGATLFGDHLSRTRQQ